MKAEAFVPIGPPLESGRRREYRAIGQADVHEHGIDYAVLENTSEASIIARHVFARKAERLAAIDYAIEYHLAEGYAGGDVVDVYEFDNGSVAFTAADVQGRGVQAAQLAMLVKFSLRAYASAGMTPEAVMRTVDRLYLEHCSFERIESFASAFFAYIDIERHTIAYCSAGHELAVLTRPDEPPELLPVTAPIIGVFEDQHQLFSQSNTHLTPGTTLLLATNGVSDARRDGTSFGGERLLEIVGSMRETPVRDLANFIIEETLRFSSGTARDDIALLVVRFLAP